MFTDISIDGKKEKCFLICKGEKKTLKNIITKDLTLPDLVDFTSYLKTDVSEKLFIKITPSKYGKDNLVNFLLRNILSERVFLNAKTIKEYRYTQKLAAIGINTPKVYAGGFLLSNVYKYSGIIIYEKLDNLVTAQEVLLEETCQKKKSLLLHNIYIDYKKMAKNNLHFRDFHMSNVLVDPEDMKIYWIDPALSRVVNF